MWRVCLYFISFALLFVLLSLLSSRCRSLLWLSLFVLLLCLCGSLGVVVVSFSLSDYTQKERALRVGASSLVLLCVCSNSCTVIEKLLRCVFGFFQFVRLVMPTNTASIRRLTRFHFDFVRHYVDITYNPSAFLK